MGTRLLVLPLPPDVSSAATTDLDALGAAAELQFGDSDARYSHADWARGQQTELVCHAAMSYIVLGRPPALQADVLSGFPSYQRPSFSKIQKLAGKARLHTTDGGIVLLVRQLTPPHRSESPRSGGRAACSLKDEHVRIYSPLVMRL